MSYLKGRRVGCEMWFNSPPPLFWWGSCLFEYCAVYFQASFDFVSRRYEEMHNTAVSLTEEVVRPQPFGVGQANKLWAVPLLFFFFFFSQSQPPTHCIQPQLSPLLLLPPSLSIDAGSHTCHLSLLIMHGRCCWCGLSHWDWEQQEWQHYAAEQSTAPASVTQQLFFRGVLHLQWWVYGRPWQQLWDGFTR